MQSNPRHLNHLSYNGLVEPLISWTHHTHPVLHLYHHQLRVNHEGPSSSIPHLLCSAVFLFSLGNSSRPKSFPGGPSTISTTNFSRKSSRPLLPSARPPKQQLLPSESALAYPHPRHRCPGPTLQWTLLAGYTNPPSSRPATMTTAAPISKPTRLPSSSSSSVSSKR